MYQFGSMYHRKHAIDVMKTECNVNFQQMFIDHDHQVHVLDGQGVPSPPCWVEGWGEGRLLQLGLVQQVLGDRHLDRGAVRSGA